MIFHSLKSFRFRWCVVAWLLGLLLYACIPPPDLTCTLCPCGSEDSGFVCVASVQRCARKGEEASLQSRCALPQEEGSSGEVRPEGERSTSTERRPEDGGPSEETTAEPRPESLPESPPDACHANCPRITQLEGEGTVAAPVYPSGTSAPQGAVEAKARFRETWVVEGEHLDRLTRLTLVSTEDKTKIVELSWEGQASMTKRTVRLPNTLVAGMFLLVGFVGTTPIALGQTFVLQGEKGEKGQGFDSSTLAFVNLLKGFFGTSTSAKLTALAPALELKAGDASVSLDAATRTLLCQGANVQITNGDAAKDTSKANGFGNLILGYNKSAPPSPPPPFPTERTGSHNLVVGDLHSYPTTGGLVAGYQNNIVAPSSSVLGGEGNQTFGTRSVLLGGKSNRTGVPSTATPPVFDYGSHSTIAGGSSNVTYGETSSILGGFNNETGTPDNAGNGSHASVSGGYKNKASAGHASVSGGQENEASQSYASVSGGYKNKANGSFSLVCGGGSTNGGNTISKSYAVYCIHAP